MTEQSTQNVLFKLTRPVEDYEAYSKSVVCHYRTTSARNLTTAKKQLSAHQSEVSDLKNKAVYSRLCLNGVSEADSVNYALPQ